MINVGIIGYGKMGKIRHHAAESIEDVKVISIYDPEEIEITIQKVHSPEQIIENPKVHAIFICTPNY